MSQVPLATFAVTAGADRANRSVPRMLMLVTAVLAASCLVAILPVAVAGLWVAVFGFLGAALFWGALSLAAYLWGRRLAASAVRDGSLVAAVLPHGLDVGGGVVLPWSALAGIGMHWFEIAPRRSRQGLGADVATAAIERANTARGGNVGLAVVAWPHDPTVLHQAAPPPDRPQLRVRQDPAGRTVAVVVAHQLVVDGDPVVFAEALAATATTNGVPVSGPPLPPAQLRELDAWMR